MKKNRTGFIWNLLGSGMLSASSVILVILVSREQGVSAAGEFSIAQTTAQLLYMVGIYGVNTLQMTDYQSNYSFPHYYSFKVITSFLMVIVSLIVIKLLGFSGNKEILTYLLIGYMLINSYAEVFQCHYFQAGRLDLNGMSLFYRTLISHLAFMIVIMLMHSAIAGMICLLATNIVATYVYSIRPMKIFPKAAIKIDFSSVRLLLKDSTPLFMSSFLMYFMTNCPRYAIETYMNDQMQGIFSIIFMPALLINLLSQFVFKPLLERISNYIQQNEKRLFDRLMIKLFLIIALITTVSSVTAYFIGPAVLGIIYKVDLYDFQKQMVTVIIGSGLQSICALLYFVLVILRSQRIILAIDLSATIVILGISFACVPSAGIDGAILAFSLGHFILLVLSYVAISHLRRIRLNA